MPNQQTYTNKSRLYLDAIKRYIMSLRDVRNVGLLVFVVLVVIVSFSGARAVQTNYALQKQIYEQTKANEVQRLANANLALTNNYYKTSQYLEVAARQNLGLAAPGETVLLVPKAVALSHAAPLLEDETDEVQGAEKALPFWQRNFRDWADFFLNRTSLD